MVDFRKLRQTKAKPRPLNPREIFNSLPKPPGINDLYASQAEVLDTWFARHNEKDIIVKLHTGGGKTLVALLMAQSVMNEFNEPVLYLAPTNQLVEQVLKLSKEYGVSAIRYPKGEAFPRDFYNGKSVMVGAYETLFNGRSRFGVSGSGQQAVGLGAIILDDAHVALSSVREAFTLTISASDHKEVYSELAARFRPGFAEVGRSGAFADIISGKDYGVAEVPSWAWLQKLAEVQQYLAGHVDEIDPFVWPFLRDSLAVCHCLFSRNAVAITPIFPPVDLLPAFDNCPRRIYMSATIADDSEIVRTFGASPAAVAKPITSASLAGIGERMILVPALMNLGETPIKQMVKNISTHLAKQKLGAVILAPSRQVAQTWTDVAEYADSTQGVSNRVAAMQAGEFFGPLVLANRYDGIDLAGNACRFLVMDGLPQGTANYDLFRMNVVAGSAVNSLLAQRFEQGIGRGTRGGSDYCVVLLIGTKLVGWIGRKNNLAQLTESTRVQLKMGQEVSETVTSTKEVGETILKCLRRDPDWVVYHASELAEAAHSSPVDMVSLRIAGGERKAFRQQRLGQFELALQTLEELINGVDLEDDPQRRAWLSASAAHIACQMGDNDRAQELQTNSFAVNNNYSPPRVRPKYVPHPKPGTQAGSIVARLLEYERRGSLIAEFDEAVADLVPQASANRYEEALCNLGLHLGFDAERPDKIHEVGPDILWRTDATFDFVLEAKNQKSDNTPLFKREHAQLLEAENWFKENYPDREAIRVSAVLEAVADRKATPTGTYALESNDVAKLVGALRNVLVQLVRSPGDEYILRQRCEAALQAAKLKPESIKNNFMKPFRKAKTTTRA